MAGDDARIDTVIVRDSSAGSSIASRAVEESMEEERPIQVRSLQYLPRPRRLPGPACPPSLPSFSIAILVVTCMRSQWEKGNRGGASCDPDTAQVRYVLNSQHSLPARMQTYAYIRTSADADWADVKPVYAPNSSSSVSQYVDVRPQVHLPFLPFRLSRRDGQRRECKARI